MRRLTSALTLSLTFALTGAIAGGRPHKMNSPDGAQPPVQIAEEHQVAGGRQGRSVGALRLRVNHAHLTGGGVDPGAAR